MWRKTAVAAALAVVTASCATTSFGPGDPKKLPKDPSPTLGGAITYVEAFVDHYRDRANSAANGRQWFEIPAFLGVFGGAVASASGGSDGGLIGAGVSSVATASNGYYAPKAKAALYRQAADAMSCVLLVGNGLTPYQSSLTTKSLVSGQDDRAVFLEMQGAAWSIERILAERLSNAGALPDAAGLAAEYEKLVAERTAKKAEAVNAVTASGTNTAEVAAIAANSAGADAARASLAAQSVALAARLQFHADLQLCVLRMKG